MSESIDLSAIPEKSPDLSKKEQEQTKSKLSWKIKLFFSCGHVFNDLCASIWFSYTLLFFQMKFGSDTIASALLLMLGQVADALATPFVGFQSDRNSKKQLLCRYGKRKTWHLLGTVLVCVSFPFIFNKCLSCENSSQITKIIYYGFFIIIFQFGWAAVQVGHMSLICDLSDNTEERVTLNAYRQAATVASFICVYTIAFFALSKEGDTSLNENNYGIFTNVVYIVCVIGIVFSILFHVFVAEPDEESPSAIIRKKSIHGSFVQRAISCRRTTTIYSVYERKNLSLRKSKKGSKIIEEKIPENGDTPQTLDLKWSDWLKLIDFYKVAYIYMFSRLFVNLTQVYTPLFLQKTLQLRLSSVAIVPFVTYIVGFIWSLISKYISVKTGPKIYLLMGCIIGLVSCFWNIFSSKEHQIHVYGAAFLFGIGSTTMLIASLSLTSDLIGSNTSSSAFVFGTMSFFDKVLNGIVVVILEEVNPYKKIKDTTISIPFHRHILVYVSGATALLTIVGVLFVLNYSKIRAKFAKNETSVLNKENNTNGANSSEI